MATIDTATFVPLASRPGFPAGLEVLLLEGNASARKEAVLCLEQCMYNVTSCSSVWEGVGIIRSRLGAPFDVVLCDASLHRGKDAAWLADAAPNVPLVLMSSKNSTQQVMSAVQHGAVDFIHKPLCPQKARTLWQHTVRRMLQPGAPSLRRAGSGMKDMETSGSEDSQGGGRRDRKQGSPDHAGGSSSSDHASTDTLTALACSLDSEPNNADAATLAALALSSAPSLAEVLSTTPPLSRSSSDLTAQEMAAVTSTAQAPAEDAAKGAVVMGAACGAPLPPLPADKAGMVWGIPTTPLKIQPPPLRPQIVQQMWDIFVNHMNRAGDGAGGKGASGAGAATTASNPPPPGADASGAGGGSAWGAGAAGGDAPMELEDCCLGELDFGFQFDGGAGLRRGSSVGGNLAGFASTGELVAMGAGLAAGCAEGVLLRRPGGGASVSAAAAGPSPLGLALHKSASLVDLINASLVADPMAC